VRYLSVCSGIEAATVAWEPLGFQPVAFAEIDKFPCAVLAHHYPTVPNWGDLSRFHAWPDASVDLLVGGTPCQSFSVAGLRAGLADPRGNLALIFLAVADQYRPEWLVWENVPGVLSSGGGRDFGAFLGGLAELGYGWAYRVLDAQYFGLAQRRRRVFVVGCLGGWQRAAAVLFERASLSGHPAPRREAGQTASDGSGGGAAFGGSNTSGPIDIATVNARGGIGRLDFDSETFIAHAFDARQSDVIQYGDQAGPLDTDGHTIAVAFHENQRAELTLNDTTGAEADASSVLSTLRSQIGAEAVAEWGSRILDSLQSPEVLRAWLHGGSLRRSSGDFRSFVDDCPLPRAEGSAAATLRKVWQEGPDGRSPQGRGLAKQLAQQLGKALPELPHARAPQPSLAVRRLTPRECERLMGFPDDYTLIPYRGKPAADGPRYKALGNSMAVPCMHWIGKRIAQVEAVTGNPSTSRVAV
jgi:DNA (cytosine-5)-methyltransferase 1